jgi:2'-5' RNA ligase
VAPFELRLGGVDFFPPAARPIVYLGVDVTEGLLAARRALLQALGPDKHRSYHPHMTLAMRLSGSAAQAMLADLRDSPLNQPGLVAPIQELWLMQRGPHDPAWRRIGKAELGG